MASAFPNAEKARRYSMVAIVLHWVIAVAIFYNLASGLLGAYLPPEFFAFHISSGITILVLSVLRVLWRLTHRPPPFLAMASWEKSLAHVVHFLLYAAMLILPFTGWALISADPPARSPGAAYSDAQLAAEGQPVWPRGPTMIWGLVELPAIDGISEVGRTPGGVPQQRALHDRFEALHFYGGWMMLLLLVLHVAGALKHQLVDRRRELARMGLGSTRSHSEQ
ncbi:cytochrome b [Sphingomonas koreensis]